MDTEKQNTSCPEQKTDQNKTDWQKRFHDPVMRWKWNAETRVERANAGKGELIGFRIFPDGTREMFTVTTTA